MIDTFMVSSSDTSSKILFYMSSFTFFAIILSDVSWIQTLKYSGSYKSIPTSLYVQIYIYVYMYLHTT